MARAAAFTRETFLESAAALAASKGPGAATTLAILRRTGAPAGSFYHRFASRDVLLAELWLGLVENYQREFLALLQVGDGVGAALFTPRWVRGHRREARILLLHRRQDFVEKQWPRSFVRRAGRLGKELQEGLRAFTTQWFGACSDEQARRVQFALIDMPLAAVRRHLAADEAIPVVIDELVRECSQALLPGLMERSA